MSLTRTQIKEAAESITTKTTVRPRIGLILGSGLGVLAEELENPVSISYEEIPHFPVSTVEGHAGQLVLGTLEGQQVVVMAGRFHLYEGHELSSVTFPIRVMKELGVETILVTNAAGGVNESYSAGDLMLIRDHINLMFRNPLIGPNDPELGVRFPDMSNAYDPDLRELARRVGDKHGIQLQEGVYTAVLGPSYETPAEIRMIRKIGGDAVGMSTVPEVITARHAGIRVLGISCISNMAAGILPQPLSHEEVMETADRVKTKFIQLVRGIIREL
ncbi:purine-nucleoside phosphorylase [Paenactinomyces guangxiensis]|uniref:Purine nucleoside phosphorylase n=1 Tax=Paenactinomyces guangxiensis TaxID=1490290 RepID=A0A7W1WTE4_9BACL|nr:purine-nucleoside phosphorylase [Paenactinomyces guangxiensis]MBA4495699.1 purine-nucleoside phosphorylase [Paenactinomyces guangxiensis]MBH8592687.1 purine-nucleoside phosphorylase [Paenactinomyces guangxiensis]